jgi:hypothetical protein
MGVESNFYIMPASSGFRPEPEAIEGLIRKLLDHRYLPKDLNWTVGTAKASGSIEDLRAALDANPTSDLRAQWRISDLATSGLLYPLAQTPVSERVYYCIEVHLVGDTAYLTSGIIQSFDSIQCACGKEIEETPVPDNDQLGAGRLPTSCPACGDPIDFAQIPMVACHPMTGAPEPGRGGITYRCAIVVDCGKCYPDYGTPVEPGFISAIESVFGGGVRVAQDFW